MILTLDDVILINEFVLLRLDLNMPLCNGKITDISRLESSLKTLNALKEKGAKTIILSHLGRPQGYDANLTLAPVCPLLKEALHQDIPFAKDIDELREMSRELKPGEFLLFENVRFFEGEEKDDPKFAMELLKASGARYFVNEAFSVSHRSHASVHMLAKRTPAVIAGYNLIEELKHLNYLSSTPKQPYMAIVAGSKISSKLLLLESFLTKVNKLFIGGAMATTFYIAQKRIEPGASLYEKDFLENAHVLLRSYARKIMLPSTVIVKAENGEISEKVVEDVLTSDVIMDIGPQGVQDWCEAFDEAHTIIWNGPLGVYEEPPFEKGTLLLAKSLVSLTKAKDVTTIIGGGDTLASVKELKNEFSYASVAGGAFLEWLEGRDLPGISSLER